MRAQFIFYTILVSMILGIHSYAQNQYQGDTIQLKIMVDKYCQSINYNDSALAASIWEHNDEIAFINPRGHEIGWDSIQKNIYQFFWDYFTQRKLTSVKEHYCIYNNVAIVDFYWDYEAVVKMNNQPIHTNGRESQVWLKKTNEWKLVHIHYSGMP